MSIQNLFATETKSLQELFSNSKQYIIPDYQREYSWTIENWEDLFEDVWSIFSYNSKLIDSDVMSKHYIGSIVLETQINGKEFFIVDGQQRLTSISLLILAGIAQLFALNTSDSKHFAERFKSLVQFEKLTDIGYYIPRLKFNNEKTKSEFEKNFIPGMAFKLLEAKSSKKFANNDAVKKMHDAYLYFFTEIKSRFASSSEEKTTSAQAIAQFINNMIENVIFIVITTTDSVSAYNIFETLNARGVELSSADLIKNYILSLCDGDRRDDHVRDWQLLSDKIGYRQMPDFIRDYLNSRATNFTKNIDLFKQVKREFVDKNSATSLLHQLRGNADLYLALQNDNQEYWYEYSKGDNEQAKKIIANLEILVDNFSLKQHIPLLMACVNNKIPIISLLTTIIIIMFRYYKICSRNSNELERKFSSIASDITQKKLNTVPTIEERLKILYISDDAVIASFGELELKNANKKLIKYILIEIDRFLDKTIDKKCTFKGTDSFFPVTDYKDSNIEHILPKSKFNNNMIGNLTLLSYEDNTKYGSETLIQKKVKNYANSYYAITQDFIVYFESHDETFNKESVAQRSLYLAHIAIKIWKINLE